VVVLIYFLTHVAGLYATENLFWKERRNAVQVQLGTKSLSASSPLDSPTLFPKTGRFTETFSAVTKLSQEAQTALGPWAERVAPFGEIRDAWVPSEKSGSVVIHIQDAHDVEEAQKNIASMVDELSKGGVSLVGVEGASGGFDFSLFKDIPDRNVADWVAEEMLRLGFIGGAEWAAVRSDKTPLLWGVENPESYIANVKALYESESRRPTAQEELGRLTVALESLKNKEYPPALRSWDRHAQAYERGEDSLSKYLTFLTERMNVCFSRYPNLDKLAKALEREKNINFSTVERHRCLLAKRLAPRLSPKEMDDLIQQSLALRSGRILATAYHDRLFTLCRSLGVPVSSDLKKYVDYLVLSESVNPEAVFNEMNELETDLPERLTATDRVRSIARADRLVSLLKKLIAHEQTPFDWSRYQSQKTVLESLPKKLHSLGSSAGFQSVSSLLAKNRLAPFEEFSKMAETRDHAFVENLTQKMLAEKTSVAVLVAGGFHTEGIKALLKKRGMAYLIVSPRVTKTPQDLSPVNSFIRAPLPLEELLAGSMVHVAYPRLTSSVQTIPQAHLRQRVFRRFVPLLAILGLLQAGSGKVEDYLSKARTIIPGLSIESPVDKTIPSARITDPNGTVRYSLVPEKIRATIVEPRPILVEMPTTMGCVFLGVAVSGRLKKREKDEDEQKKKAFREKILALLRIPTQEFTQSDYLSIAMRSGLSYQDREAVWLPIDAMIQLDWTHPGSSARLPEAREFLCTVFNDIPPDGDAPFIESRMLMLRGSSVVRSRTQRDSKTSISNRLKDLYWWVSETVSPADVRVPPLTPFDYESSRVAEFLRTYFIQMERRFPILAPGGEKRAMWESRLWDHFGVRFSPADWVDNYLSGMSANPIKLLYQFLPSGVFLKGDGTLAPWDGSGHFALMNLLDALSGSVPYGYSLNEKEAFVNGVISRLRQLSRKALGRFQGTVPVPSLEVTLEEGPGTFLSIRFALSENWLPRDVEAEIVFGSAEEANGSWSRTVTQPLLLLDPLPTRGTPLPVDPFHDVRVSLEQGWGTPLPPGRYEYLVRFRGKGQDDRSWVYPNSQPLLSTGFHQDDVFYVYPTNFGGESQSFSTGPLDVSRAKNLIGRFVHQWGVGHREGLVDFDVLLRDLKTLEPLFRMLREDLNRKIGGAKFRSSSEMMIHRKRVFSVVERLRTLWKIDYSDREAQLGRVCWQTLQLPGDPDPQGDSLDTSRSENHAPMGLLPFLGAPVYQWFFERGSPSRRAVVWAGWAEELVLGFVFLFLVQGVSVGSVVPLLLFFSVGFGLGHWTVLRRSGDRISPPAPSRAGERALLGLGGFILRGMQMVLLSTLGASVPSIETLLGLGAGLPLAVESVVLLSLIIPTLLHPMLFIFSLDGLSRFMTKISATVLIGNEGVKGRLLKNYFMGTSAQRAVGLTRFSVRAALVRRLVLSSMGGSPKSFRRRASSVSEKAPPTLEAMKQQESDGASALAGLPRAEGTSPGIVAGDLAVNITQALGEAVKVLNHVRVKA